MQYFSGVTNITPLFFCVEICTQAVILSGRDYGRSRRHIAKDLLPRTFMNIGVCKDDFNHVENLKIQTREISATLAKG